MATQLQIRRGTSAQVAAFTGAEGEIVVNTTNDSVHVNDGSTAGGFELARVDGSNWAITNDIDVTGTVTADKLIVNSGAIDEVARFEGTGSPYISWYDTGVRQAYIGSFGNNFSIVGDTPDTTVSISTGGTPRLTVDATGIDVTGTVTVASTGTTGIVANISNQANEVGEESLVWVGGQNKSNYGVMFGATPEVSTPSVQDHSFIVKTNPTTGLSHLTRLKVNSDGDISFYEDTGTTPKFFWDASAESLGIGSSAPARTLDIEAPAAAVEINSTAGGANLFLTSTAGGNLSRIRWNSAAGSFAIRDDSNSADRVVVDSAGRVGINSSAPASKLHVNTGSAGYGLTLAASSQTSGTYQLGIDSASNLAIYDTAAASQRLVISNAGLVGIGTSNPASLLTIQDATPVFEIDSTTTSNTATIQFTSSGTVDSKITHVGNTGIMTIDSGRNSSWGGKIAFVTDTVERMRIDSAGDLTVKGGRIKVRESDDGNDAVVITRDADEGYVNVYSSGTQTVEIRGNGNSYFNGGNLGIGTSSVGNFKLNIFGDGDGGRQLKVEGPSTNGLMRFSNSTSQDYSIGINSTSFIIYDDTANSYRMLVDSSGNLLVGKTSSGTNINGVELIPQGAIYSTRTSNVTGVFNRKSTDGDIVHFRKDNSTVGSIGARSSSNSYINLGDAGLTGSATGGGSLLPTTGGTTYVDNVVDLGFSGARFDDIFATNGTIQTSDRNEKQDIEALSDAEQRVAVAAKGLLRKFRWISSVEEKGDDARIHFGIIAQDLQAAFEAEGLDAGRYAMFTSTTWTDEDTGEERSRMGVRYSELLAFIISAI